MSLSVNDIRSAETDEQLFKLISSELDNCLPEYVQTDYEILLQTLRELPRGLRAMAAVHRLDVSMALDDLGWHFYNFNHRGFCDEIQWGLRELEASEAAELFEKARAMVEPHWDKIEELKEASTEEGSHTGFADWYETSGLEAALSPLNKKLWEICSASKDYGLMSYWLSYARKHPERVLEN
jgi:hypothetical protein